MSCVVRSSSRLSASCVARPRRSGARGAVLAVRAEAASDPSAAVSTRRATILASGAAAVAAAVGACSPAAVMAAEQINPETALCDEACLSGLGELAMTTTATGLQYKDLVVGDGAEAEAGFQCVVHYIAMNQDGKVFTDTLEKNAPVDVRVTGDPETANVIAGLDEGLLSMRSGGVRRLYIPGSLAFPKGLASAPGRPRIPPGSDVIFDVKLVYIPGLD
mmetsp:Transcript_31601/g.103001  ORF Transcript_31601/g.103001 Transcript_31601/m.103001 type:complete len:219 (-) Transcript_31601:103-759(-)